MLTVLGLTAQLLAAVPSDTPPPAPRPRVKAIEVSDWYSRRLTLHRRLSYATIPVFAFQWAAGEQIWEKARGAPGWARAGHQAGATALAGIFTVNTVTGVWNLWESRSSPGQLRRTVHAVSMLTASAGFTYAGVRLSEQAERDSDARALHRKIALSSIALTAVSGIAMKLTNR